MKKSVFVVVLLAIFFTQTIIANAAKLEGTEHISNYDTELEIPSDGEMYAKESISYDFGNLQKHGIYRSIPLSKIPGGDDTISLTNMVVTDKNGDYYNVEDDSDDSTAYYKIGDANQTVTGKKQYVLSYMTDHELGYFKEFTELYWNVIGTEWTVPIENVTAKILLPFDGDPTLVKIYCGQKGEKDECAEYTLVKVQTRDGEQTEVDVKVKPEFLPFQPGYGMTVAIDFPRGFISSEPTPKDFKIKEIMHFLTNCFLFLPLPLTLYFFRKRLKNMLRWGKYKKAHPLIPQYDGNGYSPSESGLIHKESYGESEIAAEITYLISEGYLDIKKEKDESSFIRTTKSSDTLKPHQLILLKGLEGKSESELTDSLYEKISTFKEILGQVVQNEGIVEEKSSSSWSSVKYSSNSWGPGFLLFFFAVNPGIFIWLFASMAFEGGWKLGFLFSATCILCGIIQIIWKSKYKINFTDKGLEAKMYIKGLYEYIRVAEKDKIVFEADPEHTLVVAEKLLPYAIVFGMEAKWIQYLEKMLDLSGIDKTRYEYHSSLIGNYALASMSAHSAYSSTMTAHAPQSSSSGSGSSGGSSGSSGGGGGGGGGGSW